MSKRRVTVSVDTELAVAAAAGVAAGRADSISAWVNDALADKAAKDQRLAALAVAVAAYEAEHGTISAEEIAAQVRADRDAAAAMRRRPKGRRGAA